MSTFFHAPDYHVYALDPKHLPRVVKLAVTQLKRRKIDAIAATGISGLIVAGAVSAATGIPVMAVRRKGEKAHNCDRVSFVGHKKVRRWAFIDDLIDSGKTLYHVIDQVYLMSARGGWDIPMFPAVALLYDLSDGAIEDAGEWTEESGYLWNDKKFVVPAVNRVSKTKGFRIPMVSIMPRADKYHRPY